MLPQIESPPIAQEPLPFAQMVLALVVAVSMFGIVYELVRRQKLREEYAILWMATAVLLVVFALWVEIPAWIADLVGAESVSSVLFFGAHVFMMLVALQFSVRLTKLSYRNKKLSQKVALLEEQLTALHERVEGLEDASPEAASPEVTIPTPERTPAPMEAPQPTEPARTRRPVS